MRINAVSTKEKLTAIGQFLLLTLIFSLAYTQEMIFNSPEKADGNQNTKYFHGLADAGYGFLKEDWLATTIDPLPAFTFLVKFTYQTINHEFIFYLYYALIMGIYLYSIVGIVDRVYNLKKESIKYYVYLAFFIFIHTVHIKIFNFDTAWHLQSGVAEQYILGPVLQPCSFGVFMVLSIYVFLDNKYILSIFCLAIAVAFHPTYFPSVAILSATYLLIMLQSEKKISQVISIAFITLILFLPSFCYMYFTFDDTSPELAERARHIIVNLRIPHHSIPSKWLKDGTAYVQTIFVAIALYLIRGTKLFPILLISFLVAISLTIVQIFINNDTLAFVAPWRISAFLVPISTGIIIGSIVNFLFEKYGNSFVARKLIVKGISLFLISILFFIGLNRQIELVNYQGKTKEMLNYVRQNKQSGDVYLVPPDQKRLQKFRLYTGAPILTNKKSHPYKDIEVIEWYKRVELARKFYQGDRNSCQSLQYILSNYQVTHVVLENEQFNQNCHLLTELYRDDRYGVYGIDRSMH